jgi:hypothetical protein
VTRDTSSVWLYGSSARGDSDEFSDLDVVVVGQDREIDDKFRAFLHNFGIPQAALSRYTWAEIEGMSTYGSLFLQHLKSEGCPIVEGCHVRGRLNNILRRLGRYSRARQDLRAFQMGLTEARQSLLTGGSLPFELSVLATIVRHSCILGCYLIGQPTFGRSEPVRVICNEWHLPPGISQDYQYLYQYKLLAETRVSQVTTQLAQKDAIQWCERIDGLLGRLEVEVERYCSEMSR